jgi:protease II
MLEDFKIHGPSFNQDLYKSYMVHVPAADGELIPLSVIHKKKYIIINI